MLARVLAVALCLSVCLSVCHKSDFCRHSSMNQAGFWHGSFLPPILQCKGKGKVFPYSLPSVGPGADPCFQAVSPQVT